MTIFINNLLLVMSVDGIINKCISRTDTNPPFAFQIAFPRGTDFTGFYREGQKATYAACKPLFLAVAEI